VAGVGGGSRSCYFGAPAVIVYRSAAARASCRHVLVLVLSSVEGRALGSGSSLVVAPAVPTIPAISAVPAHAVAAERTGKEDGESELGLGLSLGLGHGSYQVRRPRSSIEPRVADSTLVYPALLYATPSGRCLESGINKSRIRLSQIARFGSAGFCACFCPIISIGLNPYTPSSLPLAATHAKRIG